MLPSLQPSIIIFNLHSCYQQAKEHLTWLKNTFSYLGSVCHKSSYSSNKIPNRNLNKYISIHNSNTQHLYISVYVCMYVSPSLASYSFYVWEKLIFTSVFKMNISYLEFNPPEFFLPYLFKIFKLFQVKYLKYQCDSFTEKQEIHLFIGFCHYIGQIIKPFFPAICCVCFFFLNTCFYEIMLQL